MLSVNSLSVGVENFFTILKDITFTVPASGITGILGESGSGKSMLAKTVTGLLPNGVKKFSGTISFNGAALTSPKDFEDIRGRGISMIFQHPSSALNPVFTIGEQLTETICFHDRVSKSAARLKAAELLDKTGIGHSKERLNAYPHQLSGGMNQRVMIALAIAARPKLLIADEPTTALDVLTQNQIIALLAELAKDRDFGILFITHDISLIESIADNILVLYAGEMIEILSGADLKSGNMLHPCTKALKACLPKLTTEPLSAPLYTIPGQIVQNTEEFNGKCIFADRCGQHIPVCSKEKPKFVDNVKCFIYN
ncbi:MAG: ABC transporter ATP-binding protein [Deferribacteraceae bacterium]|jgi:ABC-type dipeptide/oligopeptide/nickel transport system ATPase component|nr:ABC transporter ATP-binding protein [Deferribacteraceae bacterium]